MILQVKVITKASENKVIGFEGNILKIKCTAVPEKGKANEAVVSLLAEHYNVSKRNIKILKGHKSSKKTIQIDS